MTMGNQKVRLSSGLSKKFKLSSEVKLQIDTDDGIANMNIKYNKIVDTGTEFC